MMHMRQKRIWSWSERVQDRNKVTLGFSDVPADDPQIRPVYRLIEQQYTDREIWHFYNCGDMGFQEQLLSWCTQEN